MHSREVPSSRGRVQRAKLHLLVGCDDENLEIKSTVIVIVAPSLTSGRGVCAWCPTHRNLSARST